MSLQLSKVDELRDRVLEYAAAAVEEPVPEGCVYLGGWLGAHWGTGAMEPERTLALLYYFRVLVHDPLADYFFSDTDRLRSNHPVHMGRGVTVQTVGPREMAETQSYGAIRADPDEAKSRLWQIITSVVSAEPLLRSGVLQARPQFPVLLSRSQPLEASVRHDLRDPAMWQVYRRYDDAPAEQQLQVWDNIRGGRVTINERGYHNDSSLVAEPSYYYLAKTLGIADNYGAVYAPDTPASLDLLRAKASRLSAKIDGRNVPLTTLPTVAELLVPGLALDLRTAVKMRQSEADFEDWRRSLRELERACRDDDPAELVAHVEDSLLPQVEKLSKRVNASSTLSSLRTMGSNFAITGGVDLAAAGMTGDASVAKAIAVSATTGVLQWIYSAYKAPRLGGRDAILGALLKGTR
ncbi:hypothetical protein AXZ95_0611 [Leifsonia sp. 115AMFTsu3.1]|nr:hypothetical protein AXZ95_0611 [Leifsonia sp. 115AMFTsu3.1]